MTAEVVEAHLARARAARRAGDGATVTEALDAAWSATSDLQDDHPLTVVVAWKRAKGLQDFASAAEAAAAIAPIAEREDLFSAYPPAIQGAERICRAYQDQEGYGEAVVRALWQRLGAHHRARGDAYLAAVAQLQLAWDDACRGTDVDGALAPVLALRPEDLAGGPTRHAQAPDAAGSLAWLHLDAAHTALRAAVWCGDAEAADEAASELVHAVEEIDAAPRAHIRHALLEAAHHGYISGRELASLTDPGFDGRFVAALEAGSGFAAVAEIAPGPEWRIAALSCGVRTGEVDPQVVHQQAERFACHAFLLQASRSARI